MIQQFHSGYLPEENKTTNLKTYMHPKYLLQNSYITRYETNYG